MRRSRRELLAFGLTLGACLLAFFHESIVGGKVLSPADILLAEASFHDGRDGERTGPANRLLIDPVLQFQPWLEFNRRMIRSGRLPLWNPYSGCGAPHLANGQSAVFDPFHLIAYLGRLPDAYAWMAVSRLFVAGMGMFLLARLWGLGRWGRWFAGLSYPFTGFLIVWLLFPVTSVAVWMPWLLIAIDRVFLSPGRGSVVGLAVATAAVILGGHIQTSAHVLLAGALYVVWRIAGTRVVEHRSSAFAWLVGTALGLGLAAVQVLPLGAYLSRSPVWGDRLREKPPWWSIARPRLLDAACTAIPYLYGSQRHGHPNLARALGVHNLNESAGGYTGLATLVWLAPVGVMAHRRNPRAGFLTVLGIVGALAAFRMPLVDNLLRACPVLDVTDNRRLSLWIAFALAMLGGIGLDRLGRTPRLPRTWLGLWILVGGTLVVVSGGLRQFEPMIRARAESHYGSLGVIDASRTDRQVRAALDFLPRYYAIVGLELVILGVMAWSIRGRTRATRQVLFVATIAEMLTFGYGLNPAIDRQIHTFEPATIGRLREGLIPGARAVGVGAELPPNVLMRFELADVRNYDSVELASTLRWLGPIFEPGPEALTSRRDLTWRSAASAVHRLRESCVGAIIGATPPPPGVFDRIERIGEAWVAWLHPAPWAEAGPMTLLQWSRSTDSARFCVNADRPDELIVRESIDPGWRAEVDGHLVATGTGPFLRVCIQKGVHKISLRYDPPEVRVGLVISAIAMAACFVVAALPSRAGFPGIARRGAWTDPSRRVKIGLSTSSGLQRPAHQPEG